MSRDLLSVHQRCWAKARNLPPAALNHKLFPLGKLVVRVVRWSEREPGARLGIAKE